MGSRHLLPEEPAQAQDTIDSVLSQACFGLAEQCDVSDPVAARALAENVERSELMNLERWY
jgi:hypothetical protein